MAKAISKQEPETMNPGIMMVMSYVLVLGVNAVVFFIANALHPDQVVLGNMSLSLPWAVLLSSGVLSLLLTFCMPFINLMENQIKRPWAPPELISIYLVLNLVFLWLVTRASHIFGLGVKSWMVVVLLAVLLDFLQGAVMMLLEKMRTKK